MSGSFAMILHQPRRAVPQAAIAAVLAPLLRPGVPLPVVRLADERIGIATLGSPGTADGIWHASTGEYEDLVVVALAQLCDLPRLRRDLGGRVDPQRAASHPELIAHAYREWGDACPEHLAGDFAFVLYDRRRDRLLAAVDPMGVHRLFYREVPGQGLILASAEACILAGLARPLEWDPVALALWLSAKPDRERSLFRGVETLACGRRLVSEGNRRSVSRWWSPERLPTVRYRRTQEYADHYRDLLLRSVDDRLTAAPGPIVCELSGGLDSTSVAASCARYSRQRGIALHAVSHLYPGFPACDETALIGEVRDCLDIPGNGFDAAKLMLDHYPLDFAPRAEAPGAYEHPLQQAVLRETVRLGGQTIVTGHGGDELTTGDVRWWLASRLLDGDLGALRELSGIRRRCALSWPLAIRAWVLVPLARTLLARHAPTQGWPWRPSAVPAWMSPKGELAERFRERLGELRTVGGLDPAGRDILTALRTSTSLSYLDAYRANALVAGVQIVAPLLDTRILAFAIGTPPGLWYRDGWHKWLVRHAFRQTLPDSVCWKRAKTGFDEIADRAWELRRGRIEELILWVDRRRDRHWAIADVLSYRAGPEGATATGIHQEFALVLALWLRRERSTNLGRRHSVLYPEPKTEPAPGADRIQPGTQTL